MGSEIIAQEAQSNCPSLAARGQWHFPFGYRLACYQAIMSGPLRAGQTVQQKMEVLHQVAIFNVLREEVLRYIAERAVVRNYGADEIIFSEDDPCEGLYVIQSGTGKDFEILGRRPRAVARQGVVFTLTSSNQALVSEIGTVRELVSRNLSELQAQNLLHIQGKTIMIPDVDALRRVAKSEQ